MKERAREGRKGLGREKNGRRRPRRKGSLGGRKEAKDDSKGPGTEGKGWKGPGWEGGAQLRKKEPNEGREGKRGQGGKEGPMWGRKGP